MRKVENPTVVLPGGYELHDDEHFAYLVYGGKIVATFSAAGVDPAEIVKAAEQHQRQARQQ